MQRDELIDALRGFALFGILAVNIQCFVTGLSAPSLGTLDGMSPLADHLTVLATAFLLEFKFYPLFSFCFGYGFAVQTRRWAAAGVAIGPRFSRRLSAMLFMGILHGVLLWFGDILTRYAIAGFILKRYAGCGPKRLIAAARFWFVVAVAAMIVSGAMVVTVTSPDETGTALVNQEQMRADTAGAFSAYTRGSYVEATIQRTKDYMSITFAFIMLVPHFMVLFLLGAIAARLGLLKRPERYRQFWKTMLRFGLWVGIPINAVHAWLEWQASMNPGTSGSLLTMVIGDLAPILSLAMVAWLALHGASGAEQRLVRLLAPAGRIALTMYVSQSVLMALLLSGFGFGLGTVATPSQLLLIAIGIYLTLMGASHLMQRYSIPGPLEILWRRYTYADENSTPLLK